MRRHYQKPARRVEVRPFDARQQAGAQFLAHLQDRVDPGVAGHHDPLRRHALAEQVARGIRSRGEVQRAQAGGEDAVELFRKGLRQVTGAQASFHVAHGNPAVKGRQRATKRGGGVALHQHDVRPFGGEHLFDGRQNPRGQLRQRLAWLHQVQVVVRLDAESVQHLVQHLPVLRGDAAFHLEIARPLAQMEQDGAEFDGFRPGTEYQENFGHFCYSIARRTRRGR